MTCKTEENISTKVKYENKSRLTQKLYPIFKPSNNKDRSAFKKSNSGKGRHTHHQSFSNNTRSVTYNRSIPTKKCTPTDDPT